MPICLYTNIPIYLYTYVYLCIPICLRSIRCALWPHAFGKATESKMHACTALPLAHTVCVTPRRDCASSEAVDRSVARAAGRGGGSNSREKRASPAHRTEHHFFVFVCFFRGASGDIEACASLPLWSMAAIEVKQSCLTMSRHSSLLGGFGGLVYRLPQDLSEHPAARGRVTFWKSP